MEAKVNNFQNNAKDSNIILTSESNEMDLSVKLSKIFSYNGHNVSFIKTSYGILLNATQMAKAFNKKPAEYLRLPSVNQLIKSMVGFSHLSENQIVTTMLGSPENGGGTWMFEDLAIDFARWLDTDFRLWCNSKIKEFLTSNLVSIPNFTDPAEAAEEWAKQYRRAQQAESIALAEHKRAEQERMEKEIAVNTLEEKKGDIEFSESFKKVDHENMWLIRDVAKKLEQNGIIIAEKNLRLFLEEVEFMFRNGQGRWELYSDIVKNKFGVYRSYFVDKYSGERVNQQTIYMTGAGYEATLKGIKEKCRSLFLKYGKFEDPNF